ncbi:MAG: LacI family DNA-binding transcriptional regulator [Lentisphaeria bacterium]|nr:LacI family DNA-binding transcriptional regulator [Lentisphaeria bacterium]
MSKITINDIARKTGVSKATVSYVLNGRSSGFNISPATVDKVLKTCQELFYRPDEAAVLLSNRRKQPLKLLFLSPWLYSQFSDFMEQVNVTLHKRMEKDSLQVTFKPYVNGELNKALRPSAVKRYEAVLLVGTDKEDEVWLEKNADQLPHTVLLNREAKGFCCVRGNDEEASAELAGKIGRAHYSRYLAFSGSGSTYCEQRRCRGFSARLDQAGAAGEICRISGAAEIMQKIRKAFEKDASPLLVFIPQYAAAAMVQKLAQQENIRIPEQLGIASYDRHSLLSSFITPSLTTADPCLEKMTNEALDMVLAVRQGTVVQEVRIISAQIINGESTVHSTAERNML